MNRIGCKNCGVDRNLMIKAEVRDYNEGTSGKLNWLCVECFMEIFGMKIPEKYKDLWLSDEVQK